jgi:hypothetical protein
LGEPEFFLIFLDFADGRTIPLGGATDTFPYEFKTIQVQIIPDYS